MAKVFNFLEMWQGSQNLHATQKKSGSENNQMKAIRYMSNTEETVKVSWSNFWQEGAAAFQLLEISPLRPALSTKDLSGWRTQVLNFSQNNTFDHHPAKGCQDWVPEYTSNTGNWLYRDGDFKHPKESEDDWEADNRSDMELENGIVNLVGPGQWNLYAAPNVSSLIQPIWRWKKQA